MNMKKLVIRQAVADDVTKIAQIEEKKKEEAEQRKALKTKNKKKN